MLGEGQMDSTVGRATVHITGHGSLTAGGSHYNSRSRQQNHQVFFFLFLFFPCLFLSIRKTTASLTRMIVASQPNT
ncbi:hypothetical protein CH063_04164 [Colletotrichum higginsianum]|uniref:Uncharacterized protein n=1 Tax=Colletotrichum higginsianum (strain IMI 349063) TaxID=759273 RepID=H1W4P2_COLHI|nr:hypothetical protein CH063_04164 [Colletotrichum higginsianum]